ncbi:MAG: cytochrome c [Proteobacteria bacterium]|nr:cytochrome c [Pseudomonadota bacterium]
MRFTFKSVLAVAGFAFALAAFDMSPVSSASADVIKDRKALMKTVSKSNKVIKKYKKGEATAEEAIAATKAMRKALKSAMAKDLWPKGSTRPDTAATKTRAKAKILEDWDGFVKAGIKTRKNANKLIILMKAGDMASVKKAKLSCGGCHKPFRGKKVKK